MRNNNLSKIAALVIVIAAFMSCKKDYITGGSVHNVDMYKNTLSYDVLKQIPGYDTVLILFDSAGLKDKINTPGTTFFPPNNSAILNYLNARTIALQQGNANAKFGFDSLIYNVKNNIRGIRDSLGMYFISSALPYAALTNTGAKYATQLAGDTAVISFEYVNTNTGLGYSSLVSGIPQVVYYTKMWYPYGNLTDANPAGKIPGTIGARTICQTSGIVTKNGIMHTLPYNLNLFFYGTKK